MSSKDLLSEIPLSLATAATASEANWVNTDFDYDIAIGGVPFLAAASDTYPYQRNTTPWRKEQFDAADDPGEHSFSAWWLRSQLSFHGGEGIRYLEPPDDEVVRIQYAASAGVDTWERGEVTLLHDTTEVETGVGATLLMGYDDGGTDMFLMANGSTVKRCDGSVAGGVAATWGGSGTVLSMVNDGRDAYIADNSHIYQMDMVSGSGTEIWDTGTSTVALGWAKQRLVAGIGPSLYELTGTGPGLPIPVYTHPQDDWQWTSIADGPDAIYAAGAIGAKGAIFKFTLDPDGAMPVLSSATVAAELPSGEVPHVIETYLGSYMVIGTNLGVRIGVLSDNGDIQYGPLTVETEYPVRSVAALDRFVWCGVEAHIDGSSGLIRIDLSAEVEPLRFAYANDLIINEVKPVYGVTSFGTSDRMVIGCDGAYLEEDTKLVSSGYLTTGQVRYSTLEYKQYVGANVRADLTDGTITLSRVNRDGVAVSVITLGASVDLRETIGLQGSAPEEDLGLKFTLNRDSVDDTAGPVLHGWQMKALPHQFNLGETLRVPLMLFDFESDGNREEGYEGWAYDRYRSLKLVEGLGVTARFQDLRVEESLTAVIEDVTLIMTSPPAGTSTGWGGIVYVTMREVVL